MRSCRFSTRRAVGDVDRGFRWAPPPSGASSCASCGAGAYTLPGSAACATCPDGTALSTTTYTCIPTAGAGTTAGLGLFIKGTVGDIAAFATAVNPAGITSATDYMDSTALAINMQPGSFLSTGVYASIPATLPKGSNALTIAAFVKCAPFQTPAQSSVFEWGAPGVVGSALKAGLSVASTPGRCGHHSTCMSASVCRSKVKSAPSLAPSFRRSQILRVPSAAPAGGASQLN